MADRLRADVTVLSEQNSVANRKAANVSDCRYISCSFASRNDMHWNAGMPAAHMALTVSSIDETSCDMPIGPLVPLPHGST